MLFILVNDLLHHLLHLAADLGVLKPIKGKVAQCRISLCVTYVRIFANPDQYEFTAINSILECFGNLSGLVTNLAKTTPSVAGLDL